MPKPAPALKAIELETERFRLVPISPFRLARQTLHWTGEHDAFANLGWRTSGWIFRRWWRHLRAQTRKGRMCHGIWPKEGGPCIGIHVLVTSARDNTALLGVLVGERDWWGKGVVVEVRQAVIDDAFGRLGLDRLWGTVHARNFPSVFNYQALGFRHEGVMRSAAIDAQGKRTDSLVFAMLREEWLARRGGAPDGGQA